MSEDGETTLRSALFREIADGRLKRLQFLGYWLLLAGSIVGFALATILAIGAGEHLVGGDLLQAQAKLRDWFSLPLVLLFGLVMALFMFVGANLKAKRLRDMGLPGWWSVLVIVVVTGAVSATVSNQASNGLYTLIFLTLLLAPSDVFGKR